MKSLRDYLKSRKEIKAFKVARTYTLRYGERFTFTYKNDSSLVIHCYSKDHYVEGTISLTNFDITFQGNDVFEEFMNKRFTGIRGLI